MNIHIELFHKRSLLKHLAAGFMLVFLMMGCESNVASDYSPPDDHALSKDGIMHKSGLNAPDANCTACHGDDLRGGTTDVSCYECHGKKW